MQFLKSKRFKEKPEKILIVRTDRIGDIVLSTPVIKNLRLAFKNSHIAFMCRPYTLEVLEGNPYLDEVIVYDKDFKHKSSFASAIFSIRLKKKKFDWAIILHPTLRVHLISFFAGIPFRVGWDAKGGWLLTKRLPYIKHLGLKHELEYTLSILEFIGVPIVDKSMYFPIKKESEEKIEEFLKKHDINKFIVIHPWASCPSKRWPVNYFKELIDILKKETEFNVIIVSEKKEETDLFKDLDTINLNLNLSMLGSLLKRANLFISNDSGPVHIASALNTPVISIFGRNQPGLSFVRWRPLGENSFYFHKDVGCNICLAHNCRKGFLCLKEIKPKEVAIKAIEILNKS